mmetsp:Transcript_108235/g.231092  ORF Transcript_108235/g.231092 Transcript_108235/m.231092 type:complete len:222 (-) Transcript_108235:145-810(-)
MSASEHWSQSSAHRPGRCRPNRGSPRTWTATSLCSPGAMTSMKVACAAASDRASSFVTGPVLPRSRRDSREGGQHDPLFLPFVHFHHGNLLLLDRARVSRPTECPQPSAMQLPWHQAPSPQTQMSLFRVRLQPRLQQLLEWARAWRQAPSLLLQARPLQPQLRGRVRPSWARLLQLWARPLLLFRAPWLPAWPPLGARPPLGALPLMPLLVGSLPKVQPLL